MAENTQFAYGLMMSFGNFTVSPVEFAILLPEKKSREQSAVLLSNDFQEGNEVGIQSLIDILKFGWDYEPSATRQIKSGDSDPKLLD